MKKIGHTHYSYFNQLIILICSIVLGACVESYSGNSGRSEVAASNQDTTAGATAEPTPTPTPTVEQRPSGAVFFDRNFCACFQQKPVILSDCQAYCADRNDLTPTGYFNFTLGAEVTENANLGDLNNWCTATLASTTSSTGCYLEAKFGAETQRITGLTISGNTIQANLQILDDDKTYIMTLVEQSSGARSDSVHLRKIDPEETSSNTDGVLKIIGANQYNCFFRSGLQDSNNLFYDYNISKTYYYVDNNLPPNVVPGHPSIVCHDNQLFGNDDNPLYPRLNLQESVFYLWDQNQVKFYDLNNNSSLDINEELTQRFTEAGVVGNTQTFAKLEWFFYPQGALSTGTDDNTSTDNSQLNNSAPPTLAKLGFFMSPFVEGNNNTGLCPKQSDFNGTSPLFNILKDYIGGDTEGIYLAVREPLSYSYTDANGIVQTVSSPDDFLIIREGLLKQIWFYTNPQGLHIVPDENSVANNTIRFYYPPDTSSPFVKKSYQRVFTVTHPNIYNGDPNAIPTSIIPSDKRFGCIPCQGQCDSGI